jgi:uncharacterized membrane protein
MSTYSGAAGLLGWIGHELQWRGPVTELGRRQGDVEQLYRGDPNTVRSIVSRYGIDYVVVGDLERQQYGAEVDERLDAALPVAFRSGRLTIYRAA